MNNQQDQKSLSGSYVLRRETGELDKKYALIINEDLKLIRIANPVNEEFYTVTENRLQMAVWYRFEKIKGTLVVDVNGSYILFTLEGDGSISVFSNIDYTYYEGNRAVLKGPAEVPPIRIYKKIDSN